MRISLKGSLKGFLPALFFAATLPLAAGLSHADDDDLSEAAIKQLVQQEIVRLLTTEGALDLAIEEAITRIVRKQRAAAADAQLAKQQAQAQNLRPVDLQRDHIFGDPEAPLTLLEYSDFECPYCERFHPEVAALLADNPGRIRWVYRHFPLGEIHPGAHKLAEASECVAELDGNDAFWKYADLIYEKAAAEGHGFAAANLRPLAEEIGVDGGAFAECMDGGAMAERVREDYQDAAAIGISGTPSSFIKDRHGEMRVIRGAASLEEMQALVDELL